MGCICMLILSHFCLGLGAKGIDGFVKCQRLGDTMLWIFNDSVVGFPHPMFSDVCASPAPICLSIVCVRHLAFKDL